MKVHFGTTADGKSVELYTLTNTRGLQAKISTYGGIVTALRVPDRHGKLDDVVLGCDALGGYLSAHPYFGATIGRYANRIAGGRIRLEGREYQLTTNDEGNHLHGGCHGFDKVIWEASEGDDRNGPALELRYVSVDGEEGYPGNLSVLITYTVTEDNELRIDYSATTDRVTIVNLPEIFPTALPRRATDSTRSEAAFAWRHSTTRILQIIRASPARSSDQERFTRKLRFTGFR